MKYQWFACRCECVCQVFAFCFFVIRVGSFESWGYRRAWGKFHPKICIFPQEAWKFVAKVLLSIFFLYTCGLIYPLDLL